MAVQNRIGVLDGLGDGALPDLNPWQTLASYGRKRDVRMRPFRVPGRVIA